MSNVQVGRGLGISTYVCLFSGVWPNIHQYCGQSGVMYQANVLTQDTRPTWTLDIGHCRRTLNIPKQTTK